MPKYDFRCQQCGHTFEAEKRMSDPCPPCSQCGEQTTVYFGGGGSPKAHFTGGGWAADNYATVNKPLTVNQILDRNSK
jgi:putative FmdB family regulatory protein